MSVTGIPYILEYKPGLKYKPGLEYKTGVSHAQSRLHDCSNRSRASIPSNTSRVSKVDSTGGYRTFQAFVYCSLSETHGYQDLQLPANVDVPY